MSRKFIIMNRLHLHDAVVFVLKGPQEYVALKKRATAVFHVFSLLFDGMVSGILLAVLRFISYFCKSI